MEYPECNLISENDAITDFADHNTECSIKDPLNVNSITKWDARAPSIIHLADLSKFISLRSIRERAFDGCGWLKIVYLPASLKEIGNEAFMGSGLESISTPSAAPYNLSGLDLIGDYCFALCPLEGSLRIRDVKKIGRDICESIGDIGDDYIIQKEIPYLELTNVKTVGEDAFNTIGIKKN